MTREELVERIGDPLVGWRAPRLQRHLRKGIEAAIDYLQDPEFDAAVEWLLNSGEISEDTRAQFDRIAQGQEKAP